MTSRGSDKCVVLGCGADERTDVPDAAVLQDGRDLEDPSSSECVAVVGRDDD